MALAPVPFPIPAGFLILSTSSILENILKFFTDKADKTMFIVKIEWELILYDHFKTQLVKNF